MADFDLTTIPELTAQRLDTVAADCQQRAQDMFEKALADQRTLLASLASPAGPLMTTTSSRVESLAATPPPRTPPAADADQPDAAEAPAPEEGGQ